MFKQNKSGIPLAAVLLMVAIWTVLLTVAKPAPWLAKEGQATDLNPIEFLAAAPAGGILALIVAAYIAPNVATLAASYVAGGLTVAFAARLLAVPHDMRIAFAGSALLILYGLIVRWTRAKS